MRWRLRSSFGEEIVVVRGFDVRKEDEGRRVASVFLRAELREWLLGRHPFERETLMELYRELRGHPAAFRFGSGGEGDLARYVLPVLEDGFAQRRLVAFERRRAELPVGVIPPPQEEVDAGPEAAPADWVEIIVTDDEGEPYCGPYRLDLPDGRSLSGRLDMGGAVRVDGIPGGSCTIVLPELHVTLEGSEGRA